MNTLLIVYHSMTGGTLQMVEAAAAGARTEAEIHVEVRRASETRAEHVLAANSYLFATPENLASMSGIMKDFFDRTYYAALDRVNGRPYAAMICAGSDGSGAAAQIARIATGWRLKPVAPPLIVCTRAQSPEEIARHKIIPPENLRDCNELGAAIAMGTALGVF
jgi:multimeric flavodoxin WrbA